MQKRKESGEVVSKKGGIHENAEHIPNDQQLETPHAKK
jgi:hypothetical protein